MATLSELEAAGVVQRYDPELPPNQLEVRSIYLMRRFRDWVRDELPNVEAKWTTEINPTEQLATLLGDFCAGEEMEYPTGFHPVHPHENSVWELKTKDLRIFGWFSQKDCFIAYRIESAERVKKFGLYYGLCAETARHRDNDLELDEPRFVPGVDPYVVISNYHCA